MNLYRCFNASCPVGGDFEAAKPECPNCKAPAIELALVHYLASDPDGPLKSPNGNRRVACMALRARMPKHATGERSATSCPKCRATPIFKAHEAEDVDQHVPIVERKIEREHGVRVEQG